MECVLMAVCALGGENTATHAFLGLMCYVVMEEVVGRETQVVSMTQRCEASAFGSRR